jgi:hypothetical protein
MLSLQGAKFHHANNFVRRKYFNKTTAQKTVVHETSHWNGKFHMHIDRDYTGTFSTKHLFMPGKLYLATILRRHSGIYAEKCVKFNTH